MFQYKVPHFLKSSHLIERALLSSSAHMLTDRYCLPAASSKLHLLKLMWGEQLKPSARQMPLSVKLHCIETNAAFICKQSFSMGPPSWHQTRLLRDLWWTVKPLSALNGLLPTSALMWSAKSMYFWGSSLFALSLYDEWVPQSCLVLQYGVGYWIRSIGKWSVFSVNRSPRSLAVIQWLKGGGQGPLTSAQGFFLDAVGGAEDYGKGPPAWRTQTGAKWWRERWFRQTGAACLVPAETGTTNTRFSHCFLKWKFESTSVIVRCDSYCGGFELWLNRSHHELDKDNYSVRV